METRFAKERLDVIQEALGPELVAKFTRESLGKGGEQFLPDKTKINCWWLLFQPRSRAADSPNSSHQEGDVSIGSSGGGGC